MGRGVSVQALLLAAGSPGTLLLFDEVSIRACTWGLPPAKWWIASPWPPPPAHALSAHAEGTGRLGRRWGYDARRAAERGAALEVQSTLPFYLRSAGSGGCPRSGARQPAARLVRRAPTWAACRIAPSVGEPSWPIFSPQPPTRLSKRSPSLRPRRSDRWRRTLRSGHRQASGRGGHVGTVLEQGAWPSHEQARGAAAGLRAHLGSVLGLGPNIRAAGDPDRRLGLGHHPDVGKSAAIVVAARRPPALGLPGALPRRRGRRLAARLRGPRAVLRPGGARTGAMSRPSPATPSARRSPNLPPVPLSPVEAVAKAQRPGLALVAERDCDAHPPQWLRACTQRATYCGVASKGPRRHCDRHWPAKPLQAGVSSSLAPPCDGSSAPTGLVEGAEGTWTATATNVPARECPRSSAPNGIGTPLAAPPFRQTNSQHGAANSSGLVGRRLMLHPFGTVIESVR